MLRSIAIFAILLILCPLAFSQTTTTVSGTITDLGGQAWLRGQITFTFKPSPSNPFGPYFNSGAPFNINTTVTASLDGTGSFSGLSVPSNATISPAGSTYAVQVCSAATVASGCFVTNLTISGASQSVSSSVVPPAIQVSLAGGNAAYSDSEIINPHQGSTYTNLTDNTVHYCSTVPPCTWLSITSAGSSPTFTNLTVSGAATVGQVNNEFVVGTSSYPTILSAENAACALTPNGSVRIPSTYAGTDTFSYNIGACTRGFPAVTDLRHNVLGIGTLITSVRPAFGTGRGSGTVAILPMGSDVVLEAAGAADIHLRMPVVATTTTATLNIGANASVLVGAFTCPGCTTGLGLTQTGTSNLYAGAALVIGRETANEEVVAAANWSIVDATHLSITCAKTHSGTTDVEQQPGSMFQDGGTYNIFSPFNPAQLVGRSSPQRWLDSQLNYVYYYPANIGDPWPYSGFAFAATITGAANATPLTPGNLTFKNASAGTSMLHVTSTGITDMTLADTGPVFNNTLSVTNGLTAGGVTSNGNIFALSGVTQSVFKTVTANPAASGTFGRLASTDTISWRNNANNADIALSKTGAVSGTIPADTLNTTAFGGIQVNNVVETSLLISNTAPTIAGAGCGGTVAAIQNANGTASFDIFTGTAPTSGGCTITLPAAAHHWHCEANHTSAISTTNFIIQQTDNGASTTSVTLQLFSDVAAATAPVASDTWRTTCTAN